MPQVFKIGPYWVYFWANENAPLEPVHVHVAEGAPRWWRSGSDSSARRRTTAEVRLPYTLPYDTRKR